MVGSSTRNDGRPGDVSGEPSRELSDGFTPRPSSEGPEKDSFFLNGPHTTHTRAQMHSGSGAERATRPTRVLQTYLRPTSIGEAGNRKLPATTPSPDDPHIMALKALATRPFRYGMEALPDET